MIKPVHKILTRKLVVICLAMFGFGFALVPLYDVFCDLTGINGKTATTAASTDAAVIDTSREVIIEFIARPNKDMPWLFKPETRRIKVHPGEVHRVNYLATNPTQRLIIGQAVPSVAPGQAALFFHKIECFCFSQQQLAGGKDMLMPLQFYVDPALPKRFSTITLSYTLYDVTANMQEIASMPTKIGE
ncbi:cytochrome c oxidase assembly protein [Rheinheimera sp. WS51]|uniref:cytochrome c oxidase assembly protein n=1 Tax=Rheinheimera sp. WS51 TaxID=3425886 RepID=UPI003D8EE626